MFAANWKDPLLVLVVNDILSPILFFSFVSFVSIEQHSFFNQAEQRQTPRTPLPGPAENR